MKPLFEEKGPRNRDLFYTLGIALLAVLPVFPAVAKSLVPDWFEKGDASGYEVFAAWKNLSTSEANLCVSEDWFVLGGILCDTNGNPLASCPVLLSGPQEIERIGLRTDKSGYFLIYGSRFRDLEVPLSPHDNFLKRLNRRGGTLRACPGYPTSEDGWDYASSLGQNRECVPELLMGRIDRQFYKFTVDGKSFFSSAGFARFKKKYYAEY